MIDRPIADIIATLIEQYEKEKRLMMRCADLNPRETGDSYYCRRAIQCAKIVDALGVVKDDMRIS